MPHHPNYASGQFADEHRPLPAPQQCSHQRPPTPYRHGRAASINSGVNRRTHRNTLTRSVDSSRTLRTNRSA